MICKKIFRHNDNPHQCRTQRSNYIMFNQLTGEEGIEAENALKNFMERAEKNLCVDLNNKITERKRTEPKLFVPARKNKDFMPNISDSESDSEKSSSSDSDSENEFENFQEKNFLREIRLYVWIRWIWEEKRIRRRKGKENREEMKKEKGKEVERKELEKRKEEEKWKEFEKRN